jgi:acyl-CoA reductase-like NAD-dependent aldehyde dehydrogenase
METYSMYICGEFRDKKERILIENPATEEIFAQMPQAEESDLALCIEKAKSAQRIWREVSFKQRKDLLLGISEVILKNLKRLAELETKEIGKPIKETLFVDIPLAAKCFEYYASLMENISSPFSLNKDTIDIIQYQPFGTVAIFLPYNVPLMIFAFNTAATLAAGNAVIVKPSEFGSLSLLELANYIDELDFPKGLINILTGEGPSIGKVLALSDVDIVSFTGSSDSFKKMFENIKKPKKIICETSGVNLAVVFSDALLEEAAENVIASAFMKQGQMCINTSICLIEEDIYEGFVGKLIEKTEKIKLGEPDSFLTGMGPLRSKQHLEEVVNKVAKIKGKGGRIIKGGKRATGTKGYFYEPTIIEIGEMVYEEFFNPILLIKSFKETEIKTLIENNPTGLVLQLWSRDLKRAKDLAMSAQYGTVWINTFAQMDASTPFGGFKESGWGRVLGKWGLFEYLQPKHIGISFGKSQVSSWFG